MRAVTPINRSGKGMTRPTGLPGRSRTENERWHKSLKGERIRLGTPLSLDDARRLMEGYVKHYKIACLNSAIGYITPKNMLAGGQQEIHARRVGSWRRRENSCRFAAANLSEERICPIS